MSRVAILTGAAGGVGRATAERFAADGWALVLTDVSDAVHGVAEAVGKGDRSRAVGVVADLTEEDQIGAVDEARRTLGGSLGCLGLIAGTLQKVGSIETLDMAEWDRVMTVNLRSNVLMMKRFIPALRDAGGGAIVTISSWYGKSGHGLFSAYCASKAGVISLTHSAAAELAADRIRVNTVAPGNVGTSMHFTALREEAEKRSMSFEQMKTIEWDKIPLGRAAEPSEIAAAVAFLASKDGAYITGATIDVNGGCLFS